MFTSKWYIRAVAAVAASLLSLAGAQAAAVDYFLKIDGIPGESTDDKHKNEIEILSWSWGVAQKSAATTARAAPRPCVSDMAFTKMLDKATPALMLSAVMGAPIPRAILIGRKAGEGQFEFLKIELQNVLVSSYQVGSSGESLPIDQFSLHFASMKVEYQQQKADGTVGDIVRALIPGGC